VGFGGRSLGDQEPKYLNSPESPVYSKGRQLYGLAQAKDAMLKAGCAVVVEGYFDCVVLWQAGIQNVVSPSGTAFTPEQAKLLRRYAERVILAFDPDQAGQAATLRGIDVLLSAGMTVQVARLPAGQDPDELVRQHGADALRGWLEGGLNILEFLLGCAEQRYNFRQPEDKARAARSILPTLSKIPDGILRAEYLRVLAGRLQLDEQLLRRELEPRGTTAMRSRPPPGQAQRPVTGPERMLGALLIERPSLADELRAGGVLAQVADPSIREILETIERMRRDGISEPSPTQLMSRLDASAAALIAELVELGQSVEDKASALREVVLRLRRRARTTLSRNVRTTEELLELQKLLNQEKTDGLREAKTD
jgi:DNA primase